MPVPDADSIDAKLKTLRSNISDLGHEIDSYKAKTAAAFGAGVFLFLLAAGATYDLISGKSRVWSAQGVSRQTLIWVAGALGGIALILFAVALVRIKRRDRRLDDRLDQMEQEYAELLERTDK